MDVKAVCVVLGGYSLAILYTILCFRLCKLFGGVKPWHFIENMCVCVEEIC